MPDDRESLEPRPPGSDPKPDPLKEAGDRFAQLSRDLIDAVNSSGGFEPGGPNVDLRPVLRATAENFAAGAAAFCGITRMGIDGGHLTDEDLDLIAEIETWAAHFRMVTLVIQRALGDPPGMACQGRPGTPDTMPAGPR